MIDSHRPAPQAPAPDVPSPDWLRGLLASSGTSQREAARLLRVDERTMRRWCLAERPMPWAAAELLRRMLAD